MSNNFVLECPGNNNGKGKEIFDLLSELCKTISGGKSNNWDILCHATNYLSQCPNAIGDVLPLEETAVVAKIVKDLNVTRGDAREGKQLIDRFQKLYHDFRSMPIEPYSRRSILTFMLFSMRSQPMCDLSIKTHINKPNLMTQLFNEGSQSSVHKYENNNSVKYETNSNQTVTNSNIVENITSMARKIRGSISYDPYMSSSSTNSISIQPMPNYLRQLSTDVSFDQNYDLVQNVIYAFAGIEGVYLKKDCVTGRFKLDPSAKGLNDVQAAMMLKLSELGFYRDCVVHFTESKSGLSALGQMGQGFVSALKSELTIYYGMVAMLQDQLNIQRLERLRQPNSVFPQTERLTLMKVAVWYNEPLHRLQWLTKIAEACQTKKGGELASVVYSFQNVGCQIVKNLTKKLLIATCVPMLRMILRWLLEGGIADQDAEFFVECLHEVGADRLWHEKYRLRPNMLPKFISTELANKILVTGKSINFLCEVCQDHLPIKGRDELKASFESHPEHIFAFVPDTKLHSAIEATYQHTSKRVLDIMVGPHKLLDHLQAMRRYLLLGQGDFISILMENMKSELDKPATEVYTHDLSVIMDAALRSTNAQYDDPEVLNHLDVHIMTPYGGETGWDIISLQYTVSGPLATMLEPSMAGYQTLFKPLWRMKHMEFVLSNKIWKDQKCNTKLLRSMSTDLRKISYRLNLFTSEMIHFVHQMQYYILFEVIECNWVGLQKRVQAATALDDILVAHTDFLETIKRGAFVNSSTTSISLYMEHVYDNIIKLEIWQGKFYDLCFKELKSRNEFAQRIADSEKLGEFGMTVERKLERDQTHKIFEQMMQSSYKSLEILSSEYEKTVRGFLLALNSNDDHNLRLFGIRLDFNEYYKKRDMRLSVPLTFGDMRMSCVFGSTNKSLMGSRYSTIN